MSIALRETEFSGLAGGVALGTVAICCERWSVERARGRPVTGARRLTKLALTPRSQPCAHTNSHSENYLDSREKICRPGYRSWDVNAVLLLGVHVEDEPRVVGKQALLAFDQPTSERAPEFPPEWSEVVGSGGRR